MKKNFKLIIMTMLIVVVYACSTSEKITESKPADPVALQDFFKDPARGAYRISPDGEMIIFLAPHNGRKNVFMQKLGDTTATPLTEETERSIYNAFWESNDRIVFVKDKGGDENMHILSVKPDGSDLKDHTPFEKVRSEVLDILEDRPDEMLIQTNKRNPQIFDVYLLNTRSNEMKMVAENPGNITGWITDHDGRIRAAVTSDGVNTSLLYRETEKDKFKIVLTTSFKETLQPYIFTFDNKNLYCGSNLGRDKIALIEYDPRQAKEVKVIYENPEVDIDGVDYSRKRKTLTVINYQVDKPQKFFLDDEAKQIDAKIRRIFHNILLVSPGKIKRKTNFWCMQIAIATMADIISMM
jgi:dipeptidyl aminopeptidase/acylaminoacyl peptidase